MRVGLTGGIASGKTTVAEAFAALGVPIIDADVAARVVVQPGSPGLAAVTARFGQKILDGRGHLDRAKLRVLVFADADLRRDLENILHPLIREQMAHQAETAGGEYQIHAIPLLVENQLQDQVERVLVVDVDEATQLARLMARDSGSESQARSIVAAQATRNARRAAAQDILSNTGTVADLRQSVAALHKKYLALAREMKHRV